MAREEALLVSSLALILAIFLRKRRSFVQRMRLMSRQMQRMQQNVVILAIQSQNNMHENCWLPVTRELILRAGAVKQLRPWMRDLSIQWIWRNWKTAKELGSVLQFISHVYKHI